jgi:hypothetical protein
MLGQKGVGKAFLCVTPLSDLTGKKQVNQITSECVIADATE